MDSINVTAADETAVLIVRVFVNPVPSRCVPQQVTSQSNPAELYAPGRHRMEKVGWYNDYRTVRLPNNIYCVCHLWE